MEKTFAQISELFDQFSKDASLQVCLLYTSDAADE